MKQRAEVLEKKLDKISEVFNITEQTIIEVEKSDEIQSNADMNLKFNYLKDDFNLMRSSLVNIINRGREILEVVSNNILANPVDSDKTILAYSALVETINNSTKLLTDIYKNIVDIQIKIQPKETNDKSPNKVLSVAEITRMISKQD